MLKKLAVGIVGAAGRGGGFITAFNLNSHTRVTALCDMNEERLSATAEAHGVSKAYTNYEEMLDREKLDIVVVGTPMPYHVSQSIMALERDMHVLSEVPASVSIDESRELVQVCKKSKAKYMMAENYCYVRHIVLIREIAKAGLFGDMYFGEGEYIHELKGLNEITTWRRKWQTGINGNTYPTHSIGPLYEWMGKPRVTEVCCYGTGHHYTDPRGDRYENEDSTFTACRLDNGGMVNLRLDMLSNRPALGNFYSLQGTRGCYESSRGPGDKTKIFLMDRHEWETWHDPEELAEEFLPEEWLNPPEEAEKAGHGGGDYMQVLDFIDAIVEDREPAFGIHQAMDLTLPGLVSQQSINQGSIWLLVPDSREW